MYLYNLPDLSREGPGRFFYGAFFSEGHLGLTIRPNFFMSEVIDELDKTADDLWLPKPRFSAFFKTDLARWLHERNVTLCAVGGIATHFCVLTSVMDALCHNFKGVMLEDCSAAYPIKAHAQTMDNYRRNPLYPLFRVLKSVELEAEILE